MKKKWNLAQRFMQNMLMCSRVNNRVGIVTSTEPEETEEANGGTMDEASRGGDIIAALWAKN